jgi:hypothetical protein
VSGRAKRRRKHGPRRRTSVSRQVPPVSQSIQRPELAETLMDPEEDELLRFQVIPLLRELRTARQ